MNTHTLYISYDECGQATPYCICIMYWCIRMAVFSWDSAGVKGMANMPYSGPVNKSDPRPLSSCCDWPSAFSVTLPLTSSDKTCQWFHFVWLEVYLTFGDFLCCPSQVYPNVRPSYCIRVLFDLKETFLKNLVFAKIKKIKLCKCVKNVKNKQTKSSLRFL